MLKTHAKAKLRYASLSRANKPPQHEMSMPSSSVLCCKAYLILKLPQGNVSFPCSISHRFALPLDQILSLPILLVVSQGSVIKNFENIFPKLLLYNWWVTLTFFSTSIKLILVERFQKAHKEGRCTFNVSGSTNK